jgi:hypothetical protein
MLHTSRLTSERCTLFFGVRREDEPPEKGEVSRLDKETVFIFVKISNWNDVVILNSHFRR